MRSGAYAFEEIRQKLSPLFLEEGLQLVLLFGSQISGQTHAKSDIDLGFLYDGPVDIIHLINRVTPLLHTDQVDVVDLRRAGPLLCFSAAHGGKVLYEQPPGRFNAFYSLSFRRYMDTGKLREARNRAVQRFAEKKRQG
jgi:uncharacterized protein